MRNPPFVLNSAFYGYIAMWATRQSPYHAPEGLTEVLACVKEVVEFMQKQAPRSCWFPYDEAIRADREVLTRLLKDTLLVSAQVRAWNEPKSKHGAPFVFTSRHGGPRPDDDFIDLDALVRNIVQSCIEENAENERFDARIDRKVRWSMFWGRVCFWRRWQRGTPTQVAQPLGNG